MLYMKGNTCFIVKKKQDPRSKFINGPVSRNLKRRKFLTLFKAAI